ncbi:hypothetical protein ZOSMA_114G00690 [Zostera marina]|uniref:Uncharacterized protein n=1 Tax=Zostera marina TaxID=29655 RepID=A0A0K9Q4M0_ZOSMR|nr:hypothetical protein ZOSMA_114G00690 [Zostera marina]
MVIIYRLIVDYNLNSQASIYCGSCSIVHIEFRSQNRPSSKYKSTTREDKDGLQFRINKSDPFFLK